MQLAGVARIHSLERSARRRSLPVELRCLKAFDGAEGVATTFGRVGEEVEEGRGM